MRHAIGRRLTLAVASLLICGAGVVVAATDAQAAGPTATFAKVSDWGTGWEAKYTITNGGTATITEWRVEFDLLNGSVGTYWDALLTSSGSHYVFTNRNWNGTIAPGASVSFGFLGTGSGSPANCRLNGADCGGGSTTPPPGTPGAPTVTGVTASSISLSWGASSGTVAGYRVYEGGTVVQTSTGTSATVSGLAARSTHTYTVAAYNSAGESPKSASVTGTTSGTGPGVLGTPGNLRVTGTTNSSISLAWNTSSGTVTGYRVYEGTSLLASPTSTSATITGLAACSTHTYAVAAYNSAGESPRGSVTGTTAGCPPSPLPKHFLTGYWHNFDNPAVELRLRDVPAEYDLVAVAFAEATGTPGAIRFGVDPGLSAALGGYTDAEFKNDVRTLQARGKKVILSVGGERGTISVGDSAAVANFANSVQNVMLEYGFDGVDIDLENGLNPTFMGQALRTLHARIGSRLIITMAPQTIDMQSPGASYFQLALNIKDILTVVHTQYYNSGSMLGCDQMQAYSQGTINFMTALACIQLENGLRPDQVALGLPAGPGAANGGVVSFRPPRTYPGIRGAMTWSINWDASNGNNFARTVRPHLNTLP